MVIDTPTVSEGTFSINTAINIFDIVGVIRPWLILAFYNNVAMMYMFILMRKEKIR